MVALPTWLTGKHVTAITLTPQTVSTTDGSLDDSTPVGNLFGHCDEITIRTRTEAEEISPMNTLRQNMVQIKVGTTIDLTEVLKFAGTNILASAAYDATTPVWKVSITRGAQSFLFYGLLIGYDESIRHGRSVGVASFDMLDPGSANPSYS